MSTISPPYPAIRRFTSVILGKFLHLPRKVKYLRAASQNNTSKRFLMINTSCILHWIYIDKKSQNIEHEKSLKLLLYTPESPYDLQNNWKNPCLTIEAQEDWSRNKVKRNNLRWREMYFCSLAVCIFVW